MTPEGRIKRKFSKGIALLKQRFPDRIWDRMPVTRGMGKPWLDYHFCIRIKVRGITVGQTVAGEAKRDEHHKLTKQQKDTARDLRKAGALVYVFYDDKTISDALKEIELLLCLPDAP